MKKPNVKHQPRLWRFPSLIQIVFTSCNRRAEQIAKIVFRKIVR